jgi:hypothetical protein
MTMPRARGITRGIAWRQRHSRLLSRPTLPPGRRYNTASPPIPLVDTSLCPIQAHHANLAYWAMVYPTLPAINNPNIANTRGMRSIRPPSMRPTLSRTSINPCHISQAPWPSKAADVRGLFGGFHLCLKGHMVILPFVAVPPSRGRSASPTGFSVRAGHWKTHAIPGRYCTCPNSSCSQEPR